MSQQLLDEILKEKVPDGYGREAVIIPATLYAIAEVKTSVMGKEVIKESIEKAEGLEDGFMFSADYTPRLHIKDGKVAAIEILKKK
ncbi:MAG: hypothetical protein EAX96_07820 [Candidatus Lokiarchaeota archaeon]|nr:hypothetical protein [Candidatus Lokiarchaeota archaeon]